MSLTEKLWAALAGGVFPPRTAGFNSIDYSQITEPTLGLNYALMLIGGGSVGTAGGLKVGTIAVVAASVLSEVRGEEQTLVGRRAIPAATQRSALTLVVLAIVVVALATLYILIDSKFSLQQVLFETISAFGTVGLGLFGSAVAAELKSVGMDFVAVSNDPAQVAHYADDFDWVVELDPSGREALQQIGIERVSKAVVSLSKIELSIMTVLALSELGVSQIWARAATRDHGEILSRIGAHKVVYSEASTGRRVAHAVSGFMTDYFEFEDGFAIARVKTPKTKAGSPLRESQIRTRKNVTVVGIKRAGEPLFYAEPETVPLEGDELIVSGKTTEVDSFCRLA